MRALRGQSIVGDPNVWMSPQGPIQPVVPDSQQDSVLGRQFDFPIGYNSRVTTRETEPVTFEQLRALADSCDILRTVIETRKDQVEKLKWAIKPKDDDKEPDSRCQEVEEFMAFPDGQLPFSQWLRGLLEELFVTDAPCIRPWLTNSGKPYRMEWMDGATMKRIIDEHGRTPEPPDPAYSQIMKGVPTVFYTRDELVLYPRNRRVWKLHGYSPTEQVVMTVNTAIRRALYQLQYYTEGSTPDLIFQVPAEWNMGQIKEFNDWWQDSLSGNTSSRRRAQFVPNGVAPINTKDAVLKDEYDEWLARVICYAFSVSPTAFTKQTNRATADNAHEMALQEGLQPLLQWIKSLMDLLIWKYWGYRDIEFTWKDESATDPDTQSQIDDRNLKNGSSTLNEVRAKRGNEPIDGGDVPMVYTSSGYVPIMLAAETADEAPEPAPPANQSEQAPGKDEAATTYKIAKAARKKIKPISKNIPAISNARKKLSAGIAKVFSDQKQAVLSQLKISKLAKADGEDRESDNSGDFQYLLDWLNEKSPEEYDDSLYGLFKEHIGDAAAAGVTSASVQIGLDNDDALSLANDDAISYAADRSAYLVGKRITESGEIIDNPNPEYSISDATREMLRGDITEAMESGWSNDELAAQLAENYAFSDERAMTIARTETATAAGKGSLALYKNSGQVDKKEWLSAPDCCEECQELNGEIVGIDDSFSDGSDCAPAHPNCRCTTLPVLTEEDSTSSDEDS
jgi:SPP1 gp7 family putative phage head morphogenesis protein